MMRLRSYFFHQLTLIGLEFASSAPTLWSSASWCDNNSIFRPHILFSTLESLLFRRENFMNLVAFRSLSLLREII